MASTCEGGSCETKVAAESCGSGSCEERCPCGTECGGDPIACATAMWCGSFFQAMKAAQIDVLKAKIQKAWGAKMDKAADAVLEAMGVKWQSMLAEAKAKADVREKLQQLWQEGK
ncbi:MAG: hypothetical protein HYY91_06310 [Candidatus Omnitrophica bacterium]|nr:hypothetical protein [Candidatus Omnitrophota bacterium]